MTQERAKTGTALVGRTPSITGAQIAAELVPPSQFQTASFESFRPDRDYPSQQAAVEALRRFAASWEPPEPTGLFHWRKKSTREAKPGVYLDGGFGVGKTHLLAALWHAAPGVKFYGTFIEYTALVGALGYAAALKLLRGANLVCVDEFELDDPGDTMMMTRLLSDLVASGTRIAATSNTPPNSLGEGRFAAVDFLREIQALAAHFDILRIDGLDYRRRDVDSQALALSDAELSASVNALATRGSEVSLDAFDELIDHLSTVHPSKYVKLLDGVDTIAITGVHELHDQTKALRLVAFIDRVYDSEIPVLATGTPLSEAFDQEMLHGGYRKKYLRAASRLIALTTGQLPQLAASRRLA